jgi:hypothetical protein
MRTNKMGRTLGDLTKEETEAFGAQISLDIQSLMQRTRTERRKAFISDGAFTIDDHGYAAVVTAEAIDRDTGKMEITCDILGYVEPISITLDQDDLIAVRGLLGLPDMDSYFAAFDVAVKALWKIADNIKQMPQKGSDNELYEWATLAIGCISEATDALRKINDPESTDDDS